MESEARPWAELPQELISVIADLFLASNPNALDILSFRCVCHSWRNSCPRLSRPSILSPVLSLTINRPNRPLVSYLYYSSIPSSFLSVTVIYALQKPVQSSAWVLFADEFESGRLQFRPPFCRSSFSLPIFSPKTLNLFDFDVHELGRFYNLSYYTYHGMPCIKHGQPLFRSEEVLKVVLFSDKSAVVAIFRGGVLGLNKLEEEWEVLHDGKGFRFDDIVEYNGMVLGVDRRGRVYEITHSPSRLKPIVRSIADGDGRRNRLVESLGLLYLVVRCNGDVIFKVYELDEKRRKWVEISGIDECVFFFGLDFSFSASAQDLYFDDNCILFKQHSFRSHKGEVDDKAVFCDRGSLDFYFGVCYLGARTHVDSIELYPVYSEALWPPPDWLRPTNRLERLRTMYAAMDELLMGTSKFLEINPQVLMKEGVGWSVDDFLRQDCLRIQKFAHDFKKELDTRIADEQLFSSTEASIEEMLDRLEIERSRVRAQIASLRTEGKHDSDDELQCAIEHSILQLSIEETLSWYGCLFYVLRCNLRRHNFMIFADECLASEFISPYNALSIGTPLVIDDTGRINMVRSDNENA